MGTQNNRFGAIRDLSLTESNRLQLQTAIDSSKGIEDRRRLGQFATPFELAHEIVSYGLINSNAMTGPVGPPCKPREEAAGGSFREGRYPNVTRERPAEQPERLSRRRRFAPLQAQSARSFLRI